MRTKAKALKWINDSIGKRIDFDGYYGAQCKDSVNAYASYLGFPFTAGNAITLLQPQKGWKQVKVPMPGDVFVMDYVSGGINYGHTGLVQTVRS